MKYTGDSILEILKGVMHPEKGTDIVSAGMVESITVGDGGMTIVLTPEKSNDPFISSIRSACTRAIKDKLGPDAEIKEIEVRPRVIVGKKVIKDRAVLPGVENIIAISSGKGGVGKSTIAVNLAVSLASMGYRTGLLDADIFGPSIPKMFSAGDMKPAVGGKEGSETIEPLEKYGVKILSIGFFVPQDDAVVWRGPMAGNFLKQLITQGNWGELDYLLVDLPPGTSDIHLTLVQEVPVTGAVVVSTPQDVALADVIKGVNMFRSDKINVPVLGLIENMSWFTPAELPDNKYYIFGKGGGKMMADKLGIKLLGQVPVVQSICESGDSGIPVAMEESSTGMIFRDIAAKVVFEAEKRNKDMDPTKKVEITTK